MKLSIRPNYFLLIGLVSVVLSAIVYYLLPASSQKSEELVFQPIEYEIRTSTDFSATRDSVLHDLEIEKKLNAAVDQYLANTPFERPSVTVLYKEENRWLEGSVNPNKLWYPGCLVKLGYLPIIGAKYRTEPEIFTDEFKVTLLRAYGPSENEPFGEIVDRVTGVSNYYPKSTQQRGYESWHGCRFAVHETLGEIGLLGEQSFLQKTYPSNSGLNPAGAEQFMMAIDGPNQMSTINTAVLMLLLIEGKIEPTANSLFRSLLLRDHEATSSVLGTSLPYGSIYYSKMGLGRSTVGDSAYIILPNGETLICCVFGNNVLFGSSPEAEQSAQMSLAPLIEKVIEQLDLNHSLPWIEKPEFLGSECHLTITKKGKYKLQYYISKSSDAINTVSVIQGSSNSQHSLNLSRDPYCWWSTEEIFIDQGDVKIVGVSDEVSAIRFFYSGPSDS